jgi:hypothetical protein
MTGEEIANEVREQTEQSVTTYSNTVILDFINQALEDLGQQARILYTKSAIALTIVGGAAVITIASDTDLVKAHEFRDVWFTASAPTALSEVRLRRLAFADTFQHGWRLSTTSIHLQVLGSTAGTARVDYYRKPTTMTAIGMTPDIPAEYHSLIIAFCCAKIQEREGAFSFKNNFINDYMIAKQNFIIDRIWAMEPENRMYIKQARLFGALGATKK